MDRQTAKLTGPQFRLSSDILGNEQDGPKIEAGFRKENVGLNKWGNRNSMKFGKYNNWKFEVESAKEAERLIVAQLPWKGKKVEVCSGKGCGKKTGGTPHHLHTQEW